MKHYLEQAEAVLRDVDSRDSGLTAAEAAERLAKNGRNKLAEAKKDSLIKRFFQQMADPMIIILLAAAAISAVRQMRLVVLFFILPLPLYLVPVPIDILRSRCRPSPERRAAAYTKWSL